MTTISLQPNTIKHRGLKTIVNEHIVCNGALKAAIALNKLNDDVEIIEAYKGAHYRALNTLAWYMYGIKPSN